MIYDFDPATTRDIYLNGEIETNNIAEVIQKIDAIERWYESEFEYRMNEVSKLDVISDSEVILKPKEDRITLHIMSVGGSLLNTLSLINTMENCSLPIDTIAEGYVCSGGMIIFMSGSERYTFKKTYHMWHHMSAGSTGHIENMSRDMNRCERLQEIIDKLTIEKTCGLVTQEKLDYYRDRCMDWIMIGEEAIENGFADYLIDGDSDSLKKIFIKNEEVSTNRDFVDSNGNEFDVCD